jgi:hypothetical protein
LTDIPFKRELSREKQNQTTKKMNKVKITAANIEVLEGELYRVLGEDEELFVFDVEIGAVINGRRFVLRDYVQKGARFAEYDADADCGGFYYVNHDAKAAAIRFAERIVRRGVIDLDRWDEVEESAPLEARLAAYAAEEANERAGFGGWGLGW